MAHSSSPALHADDWIALAENTELDGVHDSPLQTAVNILLPWLGLEVWLLLGEVEWVYAAVQVGILHRLAKESLCTGEKETHPSGHLVTGNHDDGADGAVLGDEAGGGTTNAR